MVVICNNVRWHYAGLEEVANSWVIKMRKQNGEHSYKSSWWWYIFSLPDQIQLTIESFINGSYSFEPMLTFRLPKKIITMWEYNDRLILKFLHKIIQPVFKKIISPNCFHLKGSPEIKDAVSFVNQALGSESYRYCIRADIKKYYASVDHKILLKQLRQHFHDTRIRKYLEDVVTIAIDDGGEISLPKIGIPKGSSLSPLFGALYLSGLERAFANSTGISYCRFMDDIIILAKTKRQYLRAKRRLQQILINLKLKLSRSKTRMGDISKGFHFLGINFAVSQNQQNNKIHVTTSLHSRTVSRALDKITAMEEGAVNPVKVQRYLSRWATWWMRVNSFSLYEYTF
jgi:retron-type reverse transcriptase